jgi:hypothetical protein
MLLIVDTVTTDSEPCGNDVLCGGNGNNTLKAVRYSDKTANIVGTRPKGHQWRLDASVIIYKGAKMAVHESDPSISGKYLLWRQ